MNKKSLAKAQFQELHIEEVDEDGKEWSKSTLDYFLVDMDIETNTFDILTTENTNISSDHYMIKLTMKERGQRFTKIIKKTTDPYDVKKMAMRTNMNYTSMAENKLKTLC